MTPFEAALLGVTIAEFFAAGLFFLKFWRTTRDFFFLAFAVFFLLDGADRIVLFFLPRPNEGDPWIYLIRLFALCWILAAILKKNYGRHP